ncbi:unnamed protein product [Rhodiola kirilowii]
MKFMSTGDDDMNLNGCRNNNDSSNNNSSSSNWLLGFSLSPNMKMEQQQQQQQVNPSDLQFHQYHHQDQAAVSSAESTAGFFFSAPPHPICYADHQTNGFQFQFHNSPSSCLSAMPLKSDGSLCIGMAHGSSPKLENFLGGVHHHNEPMSLSLDNSSRSLYFHHNAEPVASNISQSSLDFVSDQNMYLNGLNSCHHHHLYQASPVTVAQISDDNNGVKNWVSNGGEQYSTSHQEFEQQMSGKNLVSRHGGELQALTLSMSPGSQLSCLTAQISPTEAAAESPNLESKKRGFNDVVQIQKQPVHRKSLDTFGQRTSQYRGVTRHRWTGRYEAHLWDNSCKKEGQTRKGRQVYLGGYDMEEKAARAYDLAALKYWGPSTHINFSVENYQDAIEEMKNMSRQEYVAHLRRKSSGFSRGASIYRGVTRHHQHGRWQARIGRVAGNKDLYLGTFSTQEEAAEAYDVAAIKFRGVNAVTNFDISRYEVERIIASNTLLAGELAKRSTRVSSSPRTELVHVEAAATYQTKNVETMLNESIEEATRSPPMMFPKPPLGWIPSAARHAALAIPHLPVFAAWQDS